MLHRGDVENGRLWFPGDLWPLFPHQLHRRAVGCGSSFLGGVVLGAFSALRQTDLKRMVAYSSVNHVSYCLLAIFGVVCRAAGPGGVGCASPGGLLTNAAVSAFSGARCSRCSTTPPPRRFSFASASSKRSVAARLNADFGGVRSAAPALPAFAASRCSHRWTARPQRFRRGIPHLPRRLRPGPVGRCGRRLGLFATARSCSHSGSAYFTGAARRRHGWKLSRRRWF